MANGHEAAESVEIGVSQNNATHLSVLYYATCDPLYNIFEWFLLDSRVVDVPMAYNPTFVTLSSLKPFFFNGLQNE